MQRSSTTFQPATLMLALPTVLIALVALNGVLLDAGGVRVTSASRWALLALEMVLLIVLLVLERVRWSRTWLAWAEAGALASVIGVTWWALLRLAAPDYLPVGTSPDGGYHYQLIDHLRLTGRLHLYHERLGVMNIYPPGFHLVAGALADLLGVDPIYVLYPWATFGMALLVGAGSLLAARSLPDTAWRIVALLGTAVIYAALPFGLTTRQIVLEQYYPTTLGLALALALVLASSAAARSPSYAGSVWTVLLATGLATIYPFWLPLALACVLPLLVFGAGSVRWRAFHVAALLVATSATVWHLRWVLRGQSGVATQGSFGVHPLFWALVMAGVVVLIGVWRWRRQRGTAVGLLAAIATLQYLALRFGLTLGDQVALANKTSYALAVAGATAGASGLAWLGQRLIARRLRRLQATFAALLAAGATVALLVWPPGSRFDAPFHPLTRPVVAASLWTRDTLGATPTEVEYLFEYNITAYWVKVGLLRSARGWEATSVLDYPLVRYDYWDTDPTRHPYAILEERRVATLDGATTVLFEAGDTAVLGRAATPAPDAAQRHLLQMRAFTTLEPLRDESVIRTSVTLYDALDDPSLAVWLVLTPQVEGDQPPAERLWAAPLSTAYFDQYWRGGVVRWNPRGDWAEVWRDAAPQATALPDLPMGQPVSAWLELRRTDNVVATRRIYDLTLGDAQSLRLRDGDPVVLLRWERPDQPPAPPTQQRVDFGAALQLNGWTHPATWTPNQPLTLTLDWTLTAPITAPQQFLIQLQDEQGQTLARWDTLPTQGRYPFWRWAVGERLREDVVVTPPADLPAATYTLVLSVYRVSDFAQLDPLVNGESTSGLVLGSLTYRRNAP